MNTPRYGVVAVLLHWAIALAIVGNFLIGWWMHEALDDAATRSIAVNAFQVHKSLGLTVLVLSVLRLGWRLLHRPPPLPEHMPGWERLAAQVTHVAFYALMLGIPLSGWLLVSSQWRDGAALNVPTLWFGVFEVPHLFGLDQASTAVRARVAEVGSETHELLAFGAMGLLLLHVGAALKHHFVNKDSVLAGMVPLLASDRGASGRRLGLWIGSVGILVCGLIVAATLVPRTAEQSSAASSDIRSTQGGWIVDPLQSEISFAGTHAGAPFKGRFERWQAELRLDADDPLKSRLRAEIETASASDGVKLHDETLPGPEWFDVEKHPLAHFDGRVVSANEDGSYAVSGVLRIKDNPIPIDGLRLSFDGDSARLDGALVIRRADANLGMESDPDGDWVSQDIEVGVRVRAAAP